MASVQPHRVQRALPAGGSGGTRCSKSQSGQAIGADTMRGFTTGLRFDRSDRISPFAIGKLRPGSVPRHLLPGVQIIPRQDAENRGKRDKRSVVRGTKVDTEPPGLPAGENIVHALHADHFDQQQPGVPHRSCGSARPCCWNPRSLNSASCRRKNRFSAWTDRVGRNRKMENRTASARSWKAILMSATMRSSCHSLAPKVASSA